MSFFDRLGNLAKGSAKVSKDAWTEGGGLDGQLERLAEGAKAFVSGTPPDESQVDGFAEPPATRSTAAAAKVTPAAAPPPADPAAAEIAVLQAAFADGKLTRGELRRKIAEARARFGGSSGRML